MRMMKKEEGYNACPRCGKAPYEMMGDYETYHVGVFVLWNQERSYIFP